MDCESSQMKVDFPLTEVQGQMQTGCCRAPTSGAQATSAFSVPSHCGSLLFRSACGPGGLLDHQHSHAHSGEKGEAARAT